MSFSVVSRHQNKRLTYHALDQKSNALAHGLAGRGVKKGDPIAISLGNNIEYAIVRVNALFCKMALNIVRLLMHASS